MAFLVGGANSAVADDYDIDNSSCFGGTGTHLTRTQTDDEDSTAKKKFTVSIWTKQTLQGSASGWNGLWSAMVDSNNYPSLKINADKELIFEQRLSGSTVSFTADMHIKDPSAWYHIVVAYDSTDSTANDRVKVYVNGSQLTGTYGTFVEDEASWWGDNTAAGRIGAYGNNTGDAYMINGYIADACCTIGYALTPSSFGETDEDSGIWKPKEPSVTYSENGFFLEFKQSGTGADASGIGADTSGNTNHFTIDSDAGTLFQTTDSPTNNFATLNPLEFQSDGSFFDGNLKIATPNDQHGFYYSTIGVTSGKWYCEFKVVDEAESGGLNYMHVGAISQQGNDIDDNDNEKLTAQQYNYGIASSSGKFQSGNTAGATYAAVYGDDDDILSVALDLDNLRLYFALNGSWADGSGNFDESSINGYGSITAVANTVMGAYFPAIGDNVSGGSGDAILTATANFGNPSPTFAISSGNADANGYGNFEYAVPSGYYALCTKNLAEFG